MTRLSLDLTFFVPHLRLDQTQLSGPHLYSQFSYWIGELIRGWQIATPFHLLDQLYLRRQCNFYSQVHVELLQVGLGQQFHARFCWDSLCMITNLQVYFTHNICELFESLLQILQVLTNFIYQIHQSRVRIPNNFTCST